MVHTRCRSQHSELLARFSGIMCFKRLQHYPTVCFCLSAVSLKCRGFPCPFLSRSGFQRDRVQEREQENFVNDGLPGAQSASKTNPFPTLCLQQPALLINLWHCFVLSCLLSSLGDAASGDCLTCKMWTASSPEYCSRSVPCGSVRERDDHELHPHSDTGAS